MVIQPDLSLSLSDAAATHALGMRLGRSLSAGCVILLEGDLGAGKTCFVQGLGSGLGITAAIVSPTFTLINEYLEGRVPLYHFDLYRLDPAEIEGVQPELYWEGMEVEPGIVAIEWAERLPYQPASYLRIRLTYQGDGRQVEFVSVGEMDGVLEDLEGAD